MELPADGVERVPGRGEKTLAFVLNADVFPIFDFPPLRKVTKI
jgi:hypothetical protein